VRPGGRAVGRRAFGFGLVGVVGLAAMGAAGCAHDDPTIVRVGYLANLTHAPALLAVASGRLAAALGPNVRLEARTFRAGPRVVEALLGRAIDIGLTGPAPVLVAHARHGAGILRVLSGCTSGGASFVVRPSVRGPQDLRGALLAVTQTGSTQDVALRGWLRRNGLAPSERGGDVRVFALAGPTIRAQFVRGEIQGAWLPEPWATDLVQAGATRLVDERDLWEGGHFSSAMLVARGAFARARPEDTSAVTRSLHAELARIAADPDTARAESYAALERIAGRAGSHAVYDEAWKRVDFDVDPLRSAVARLADDAAATGLLPSVDTSTLFEAPRPA
jgi:NitT/TauT family transport system substrate-binding protein